MSTEQELPEPSHGRRSYLTPELRAKFERKGEALVVHEILNYQAPEKRQAAVDWMQEKREAREQRESRRFWLMFGAALIAAGASVWAILPTTGRQERPPQSSAAPVAPQTPTAAPRR